MTRLLGIRHPIVLAQIWTSMNDGILALCILIFAVSVLTWIKQEDRRFLVVGLAAMTWNLGVRRHEAVGA